jgi:hypothetical protein
LCLSLPHSAWEGNMLQKGRWKTKSAEFYLMQHEDMWLLVEKIGIKTGYSTVHLRELPWLILYSELTVRGHAFHADEQVDGGLRVLIRHAG